MTIKDIYCSVFNKSIPYRGRVDDINSVIVGISRSMANHFENDNVNFEIPYDDFIKSISISNGSCEIECDCGCISFDLVPFNVKSSFKLDFDFYDFFRHKYSFIGQCHLATLKYLKKKRNDNIVAVTSICISSKSTLFFHSYIWDKDNDLIIDFSKNIVMSKVQYDKIFCYKELNVVSYSQFLCELDEYDYYSSKYVFSKPYHNRSGEVHELLFLALFV